MTDLDETFDAILITGPTASGKSALALRLAQQHGGIVINADSMQVYDTLRLLTARPSVEDMEGVAHHLYGHVEAASAYSTGAWLRDIEGLLAELAPTRRLPVIVGGTGLYFKALTGGLSEMPAIDPAIRDLYRQRLIDEGSEVLHQELVARDAPMASLLNASDGQRIVRALEVIEATGASLLTFQAKAGPMIVDPERAQKFVVLPERQVLHDRINRRFEAMIDGGAVEEVEALLALGLPDDATVMKAIGVAQIRDMLAGHSSRQEATERAAAATRQYAKRQMTWFRNQMGEDWQRIAP